jgi:hypothetical protein
MYLSYVENLYYYYYTLVFIYSIYIYKTLASLYILDPIYLIVVVVVQRSLQGQQTYKAKKDDKEHGKWNGSKDDC